VMRGLDQLVVGRTVIMISHRLSTLGNVDEIIVLKDGQIAERGGYRELKKLGGIFAALLEEQNRYNLEKVGAQSILRSAFVPLPVSDELWQARPAPVAQQNRPASPRPSPRQATLPAAPVRGGFPHDNGDVVGQSPRRARVRIEINGRVTGVHQLDKPVLT